MPKRIRRAFLTSLFLPLALATAGCIERTLTITSDPPGALVYLNGQEIGRTPLTRDFLWYGNYDVTISADGYQALNTTQWVSPPIYQIIPLDLVAEVSPFQFKDHQRFHYTLAPTAPLDTAALLIRAEQLKGQLQSSQRPATRPSTTKSSATKPSHAKSPH
jgi:PEGA domain